MSTAPTPRNRRLWPAAAWISGTILALSILLALGSTVWRLRQSLDLLDQAETTAGEFQGMIETSLAFTRLGLWIGVVSAPAYILSLVQCHRQRSS